MVTTGQLQCQILYLRSMQASLNFRLVAITEELGYRSPAQYAFRPGLSTLHPLFGLQHLIELYAIRGERLYCCFLDLKAAYDHVSRPLLWEVLARLGVHGRMRGAIQSLYTSASFAMKIGGRIGVSQISNTGLRQGCPLSPTLFGLFLDGLTNYLAEHCPTAGCSITHTQGVSHFLYADDITLMSTTPLGLQDLINAALQFCQAVELPISGEKSSCCVFSTV